MAAQQNQNQSDTSMGFLWVLVAIFAAGLLIWYSWHAEIVGFILQLRILELGVISIFSQDAQTLATHIEAINPASVTYAQIEQISTTVGNYLRFPVAILLGALSIILYNNSSRTRFRRTFSMKSLLLQEKQNWPQVCTTTKLDLIKEDLDKGAWAMAMQPMQFAKKHQLLKLEKVPLKEGQLQKEMKVKATIIRQKVVKIFARQLGAAWVGPQQLKIHARALFAIFAAKGAGDRDAAYNLLTQIAASSEGGGRLDFSGADELLKKHIDNKLVKKVINNHAFEMTVMASMLEVARTDGVLASAEFLWLKPLDRPLWYMLNTVGRRTSFIEVAGPYAHWVAEKTIGRKLTVPMFDEAVKAFEYAISEILYIPEEDELESISDG